MIFFFFAGMFYLFLVTREQHNTMPIRFVLLQMYLTSIPNSMCVYSSVYFLGNKSSHLQPNQNQTSVLNLSSELSHLPSPTHRLQIMLFLAHFGNNLSAFQRKSGIMRGFFGKKKKQGKTLNTTLQYKANYTSRLAPVFALCSINHLLLNNKLPPNVASLSKDKHYFLQGVWVKKLAATQLRDSVLGSFNQVAIKMLARAAVKDLTGAEEICFQNGFPGNSCRGTVVNEFYQES